MGLSGDDALALAKSYTRQTAEGMGAIKGQDGFSPVIEVNTDTKSEYTLDITDKNGTFTTPNLKSGGQNNGEMVTAEDTDFYSEVTNLVNPDEWQHNTYFVDYGGSPRKRSGSGYHAIVIPVKKGKHYSSNGYLNPNFSFFDSECSEMQRTKIGNFGCTVAGEKSAYVGILNYIPQTDGCLSLVTNDNNYNDLSIIESKLQPLCYTGYKALYGIRLSGIDVALEETIYVNPNGHRDFKTISAMLNYVNSHQNIKFNVYVEKGTYDIVNELGDNYFSNVGTSVLSGLKLNNNVHLIFSSDSKVICNYTGDNKNVKKYFSPFNCEAGRHRGFIVENMNLECSNVRYAIHDETFGQANPYRNIYKNCTITIDNSNNSEGFQVCIGGGLGSECEIIIEDCYFESVHEGTRDIVSYHNNGNGKSNVFIKGSYFANNDTARCSYYGESNKMSRMMISGCSLGVAPRLIQESPDYSTINMELVSFNNEIRNE